MAFHSELLLRRLRRQTRSKSLGGILLKHKVPKQNITIYWLGFFFSFCFFFFLNAFAFPAKRHRSALAADDTDRREITLFNQVVGVKTWKTFSFIHIFFFFCFPIKTLIKVHFIKVHLIKVNFYKQYKTGVSNSIAIQKSFIEHRETTFLKL